MTNSNTDTAKQRSPNLESTRTCVSTTHSIPEIDGNVLLVFNTRQLLLAAMILSTLYRNSPMVYKQSPRNNGVTGMDTDENKLIANTVDNLSSFGVQLIRRATKEFTSLPVGSTTIMYTEGLLDWILVFTQEENKEERGKLDVKITTTVHVNHTAASKELMTTHCDDTTAMMLDIMSAIVAFKSATQKHVGDNTTTIIIKKKSAGVSQSPAAQQQYRQKVPRSAIHQQRDLTNLKFIHVRYVEQVETEDGNTIDRLYARGGYTIAVRDNLDGTLTYAVARCSVKDVYCKMTGRDLAISRLAHAFNPVTVLGSFKEFRARAIRAFDQGLVPRVNSTEQSKG